MLMEAGNWWLTTALNMIAGLACRGAPDLDQHAPHLAPCKLQLSAKHKWLNLDAHGQLEVSNVLQRHYNLTLFLAPRHCSLQVFLALCHQQSPDLHMCQ